MSQSLIDSRFISAMQFITPCSISCSFSFSKCNFQKKNQNESSRINIKYMPAFKLGNQLLMLFTRFLCVIPFCAVKSMICMALNATTVLLTHLWLGKKRKKKSIWILTMVFWTSTFSSCSLVCLQLIYHLCRSSTNSYYKRGRIVEIDIEENVSTKRYKVIRKYIEIKWSLMTALSSSILHNVVHWNCFIFRSNHLYN